MINLVYLMAPTLSCNYHKLVNKVYSTDLFCDNQMVIGRAVFFNRAIPGRFSCLFRSIQKRFTMIKCENIHPVSGAGIRTHDLLTRVSSHNHWTRTPAEVGQCLWHSRQRGRFCHQRTRIRIQTSAIHIKHLFVANCGKEKRKKEVEKGLFL